MEHLNTDLSEKHVVETIAAMEAEFTSVDALAPVVDRPAIAPETLTDAEVDERFNEAIEHIQKGTSPEERERFRNETDFKVNDKTQPGALRDT